MEMGFRDVKSLEKSPTNFTPISDYSYIVDYWMDFENHSE
jgi:hypothetical protein